MNFLKLQVLLCVLLVEATLGKGKHSQDLKQSIPDARPPPAERLFNSSTVENVITDVCSRIRDEDICRIFSNCLPSTLDTTIYWHRHRNGSEFPIPYTYIITGDIHAMWLRDSTYQVNPYVPLARNDAELRELVLGVINTQAELILLYPFGNAFFPLAHWNASIDLDPPDFGANDTVHPIFDREEVFEAKYELDSLASFLYLSKYFYEETGNTEFLNNPYWRNATERVVQTMRLLQAGTLEILGEEPYTFTRPTRTQTETQSLHGKGNPSKRCGLIRSFFRPSDDSTILQYLIPSNAMAVVGLRGVAKILRDNGRFPELAVELDTLANEVFAAIERHAIVQHPQFGTVYAFEVDCYGSHIFMDDANFPSLLSLPKFGFVEKDDPIYLNTRSYILSPEWNPYYANGTFSGIGSPHTDLEQVWPMALAMQGMTSLDEDEMLRMLWTLRNTTAGTGFMHESFDVNDPTIFTREWFAWANTVFGDFVLFLDKEYPHLLQA